MIDKNMNITGIYFIHTWIVINFMYNQAPDYSNVAFKLTSYKVGLEHNNMGLQGDCAPMQKISTASAPIKGAQVNIQVMLMIIQQPDLPAQHGCPDSV